VTSVITLNDTLPLSIGAGILGTGGGGNTYVGRIWLEKELRDRGGVVHVIDADDVPDDGLVCAVGGMGAPTVGIERLRQGNELPTVVRALEDHLGQRMSALVIGEVGGSNALRPLICGLQMGLPVVDGDPMGRAFPELQMDTFSINGVPGSPMALGDVHGNVIILDPVDSPRRAEQYARAVTIEMGATAALAMPVMSGATMKKYVIRGTLSLAQRIGKAVLAARQEHADPSDIIAALGNGRVLFRGKIVDVERRTVKGFARGRVKLIGFGNGDDEMEIVFQNENLVAWHNGEVACVVPDLICILNLDDGQPIQTEMLRYGLRVVVIGMPAARELKTPAALKSVGPGAFGYEDIAFRPLDGDLL
jgi:DUF917 family protein